MKPSYKIVFSDVDGTVLNRDHKVLPGTIAAVQLLAAKKVPFVLVSARMPEAIAPILQEIQLRMPMISYSGALVVDENGKELHSRTMHKQSVKRVLAYLQQMKSDVVINYYAGNTWYVRNQAHPAVKREAKITGVVPKQADFETLLMQNVLPHKLLCMCEPEICERLESRLRAEFSDVRVVRSSSILVEIMEQSVSKAQGMEVLLAHMGISPEDAIAFGDHYNDIEMLDFVGLGVAMQNAPEEIQKRASAVTKSNDEEGIAHFLHKIGILQS